MSPPPGHGGGNFPAVAYWNLAVAALAAIPSVLTGLLAWQFELEGRALKGILILHLLLGCTSVLLIIAVWCTHFRQRQRGEASASRYRWPLELAGVLVITLTRLPGWNSERREPSLARRRHSGRPNPAIFREPSSPSPRIYV